MLCFVTIFVNFAVEEISFVVFAIYIKYSIHIINNIIGTGQGCDTHVQELTNTWLILVTPGMVGGIKNSLTIPYLDVLSLDCILLQLFNFL